MGFARLGEWNEYVGQLRLKDWRIIWVVELMGLVRMTVSGGQAETNKGI